MLSGKLQINFSLMMRELSWWQQPELWPGGSAVKRSGSDHALAFFAHSGDIVLVL